MITKFVLLLSTWQLFKGETSPTQSGIMFPIPMLNNHSFVLDTTGLKKKKKKKKVGGAGENDVERKGLRSDGRDRF